MQQATATQQGKGNGGSRPAYAADFVCKRWYSNGNNAAGEQQRRTGLVRQLVLSTEHPSAVYRQYRVTEVRRFKAGTTHYALSARRDGEADFTPDRRLDDEAALTAFLGTLGFPRPEATVEHWLGLCVNQA